MKTQIIRSLAIIIFAGSVLWGCLDETLPGKPVACFSFDKDTAVNAGDTIGFINCTGKADGYLWDFGDGYLSKEPNPSHVFIDSGTYCVKLVVWSEHLRDSIWRYLVVKPRKSLACFNYSPASGILPGDTIKFHICSDSPGDVSWDFGDGFFSTELNPVHVYGNAGAYVVNMIVTKGMVSDTAVQIIKIDLPETKQYDTIFPLPYFPAYPDSWWKYVNHQGDTVIHTTSPGYNLYLGYHPVYSPYDTSGFYAPVYDGHFVNRYKLHYDQVSYHGGSWKTLFPEEVSKGLMFLENYIWPSTYYSGQIESVDTTVVVQSVSYDSVIVVYEYLGPCLGCLPYGRTYYAKNTGIIKSVRWAQINDSIISSEELIDFRIGNH
ncbi:MAG: PKD domain-containing protein [Bacteroidales bacterium]